VAVNMANRSPLNISPDSVYWDYLHAQRKPGAKAAKEPAETAALPRSFSDDPLFDNPDQSQTSIEISDKPTPVLPGRHYFPIYDSACVIDPNLWMTTDRITQLHHLRATDAAGENPKEVQIEVKELKSVNLSIPGVEGQDSVLGHDPIRKEIFLLLTDGRRFWFDPQTLAPTGEEQLAGYWKREVASVGHPLGRYGLRTGAALTESGYRRFMSLVVVVFLGSLLWLAWHWRTPWKFTSEATTGDSSSKSSSATT